STSNTSPRQAPINIEASNTAKKIQSNTDICEPTQLQSQDGRWQIQRLDARGGFVGRTAPIKRPDTHARALTVFGIDHLGVGLETCALQLLPHFTGLAGVGKSTDLHDETTFLGRRGSRNRSGGAPFQKCPRTR